MSTPKVKPRLRGAPDLLALGVFIPATAYLVAMAKPGLPTYGALVYAASVVFLFAASTTYHLPQWPLAIRRWLRRVDHAAIYALIAGTYTPACLHLLDPAVGRPLLWTVWGIAAAGAMKWLFWTRSPRWLTSGIYVVMGWLIVPFLGDMWARGGTFFVALIGLGGALYTFGAVVYARRWFNLRPAVFGYHEVFHLFVIAAAGCHFVAMWSVLV